MKKVIFLAVIFFGFLNLSFAGNDPLINRTLVSNLEVVLGDASADTLSVFDYKNRRLYRGVSAKIRPEYDRHDEVGGGNVIGNYREEIVVGFGKDRGPKSMRGKIAIISPRTFHIIRAFYVRFEGYDDLIVGNVYPDRGKYDEIIIGSAKRDTLEVYTGGGRLVASVNVKYERYDRISAGDVDGDGYDEIILGDASDDSIRVFKYENRKLKEIATIKAEGTFDREDDVGAGDVDGDGIDEIVFFNVNGKVRFLNLDGENKYDPINILYNKYTHVAVGDVNLDGKAEIVVASPPFVSSSHKIMGDGKIHIYDMEGRHLAQIDAKIEKYDRIALVDIDGDSVVVGKPTGPVPLTIENQIIAVLNEPPKERSLFGEPDNSSSLGKFYASYENQSSQVTEQTVTAISSATFSTSLSLSAGDLKVSGAEMSINNQLSTYSEKTKGESLEITIGQNMIADAYEDKVFALTSTYNLYEYPIITPSYLAKKNGKQQYVLVSVPVSLNTKTLGIYKSNKHVNGFVASYPQTKRELYNYSKDNEIAEWKITIACSPAGGFFAQKNGNVTISKSKTTHKIGISFKSTTTTPILTKISQSFKGEYQNTRIYTHKISFEESTSISVQYKGGFPGCDKPDKQYKVGAVLYYDKEDGHLILDYYVPEKGSFYKKPIDVRPFLNPLIFDKNGKPLKMNLIMKNIENLKNIKTIPKLPFHSK